MTSVVTESKALPASSRAVAILGAVLVMAVLAMTSYEVWRQRVSAIDSAGRNLQSVSLALAEQTDRAFHSVHLVVDATLAAIEQSGGIAASGDEAMHQALRNRAVGIPQIRGMAIIDARGQVVNALASYPPPPINVVEREYFIHHRDHPGTEVHVGVPISSPIDGNPVIPLTRRVDHADGSFAGIVLAAVDPTYFEQVYARVLPGEGGAFAMFRNDGILLARAPRADGAQLGRSYAQLKDFQPGTPSSGLSHGTSPMDGTTRMVAFTKLSAYPLRVNVSIDMDDLLEPWRGNTLRLALAAILATAILIGAVTALAGQLRREEAQTLKLRDSEERLRFAQFALDSAADLVFWVDARAHILYANRAACVRLGYDQNEITGLSIAEVDPSFTAESWPAHMAQLKREGRLRFEGRHRTRLGEIYPTEVSVTYLTFRGNEYACAFIRDISERRQAEAALAEKTARLEASNTELEQFAYVASHDLREPLRMVNSFVTMLARRYADRLDDEAKEYIGFAQEGAVRMDRLILDLLEYSRVGRLDRPLAPVPLDRAVDLATKGLGLAISDSGATLEIADNMPMVLANEEELVRLYLNLVANALKYRHPDRPPVVRLGAERRGDEVQCWVADNGIGIAPQYFERIFRIFQRLHGRDRYEGTGIGLAICKKIVERHGGRIWVDSTPESGSVFHFTLKALD